MSNWTVIQVKHDSNAHQSWLAQAYAWALARYGSRVHQAGYETAEMFLRPPAGAVEFFVCRQFYVWSDPEPVALLTFLPDFTRTQVEYVPGQALRLSYGNSEQHSKLLFPQPIVGQRKVGMIAAPGVPVRALIKVLNSFKQGLRIAGVQKLRAEMPETSEYDITRRFARLMGFTQQSDEAGEWYLELSNGTDAQ